MKPPREFLNGVGNMNFEDPALICSELELSDTFNSVAAQEIPEPQIAKELTFELPGPSEIT